MACAQWEGIGTFPIFNILGATCQIQDYILHLAILAYLSSDLRLRTLHYRAAD